MNRAQILVVDDDADWVEFVRTLLAGTGFDVDTASSAGAALDAILQRDYEALLVDYRLPGPDGLMLLGEIRKRNAHAPVILLSGVGDDALALEALKRGAAEYIDKHGLDRLRLLAAVQRARARSDREAVSADTGITAVRRWHAGVASALRALCWEASAETMVRGYVHSLVREVVDLCAIETWIREPHLWVGYRPDGTVRCIEVGIQPRDGHDEPVGSIRESQLLKGNAAGVATREIVRRVGLSVVPAMGSAIITPLAIRGERIGRLLVARVVEESPLAESDLSQLASLATALAGGLGGAAAQNRAAVAEDRLRSIVNGVGAVVWEADTRTSHITFISRLCEPMFGYPLERWLEADDCFLEHLVVAEDREQVRTAHRRCASEGEPQDLDLRIRHADGSVRWVREFVRVVAVSSGDRVLRGLLMDIDERKRREEAHAAKEALYRAFFEQSGEAMYVTSREGQIVEVNQAALKLFGATKNELLSMNARDVYANPTDRENFITAVERQECIPNYELKLRRKDGAVRTCLVSESVRRNSAGQLAGYQGIVRDATEENRAEEARERAFSTLQATLDSTADGILVIALDQPDVIALNRQAVHIWQAPAEVLESRTTDSWITWILGQLADGDNIGPMIRNLLTDSVTPRRDVLATADGRHVELYSVPYRGNAMAYRVFSFRDITAMRRNEQILRAEARILERIAADADLAEIVDRVTEMVERYMPGARCACTIHETSLPGDVAKAVTRHHREGDATRRLEGFRLARAVNILDSTGERLGEVVVHLREGASLTVDDTIPIERATFLLQIALEKLRTAMVVQEVESKYRNLVEQSLMGVFIAQDDRFVYANPRLCEIWRCSRHELLGKPMAAFWHADCQQVALGHLRACFECEVPSVNFSARSNRADGAVVDVNVYAGRTEYGGKPALIGAVLDVTEQCQLQGEIAHAQRIETVGRLAGGVAHDFNNMLTIMLGYIGNVVDLSRPGSALRSNAEEVASAAHRAAELTRQLLAFSRKQALRPCTVSINSIVAEAQTLITRALGESITLVMELHDRAGLIRVDPSQLVQTVLNLAMNARDAMPEGGRLTISTRVIRLGPSKARAQRAKSGQYAVLAMADTGVGMDEDTRRRLFEPFFTTKELGKGTGLGLSVVYGIVKQNGGFIDVRSEPARGTTFEVYWPSVRDDSDLARTAH